MVMTATKALAQLIAEPAIHAAVSTAAIEIKATKSAAGMIRARAAVFSMRWRQNRATVCTPPGVSRPTWLRSASYRAQARPTRNPMERGFEIGCRAYFDDAKVEPQGARGRTYPENAPATVRSASRNAVDVDVAFGQHQDRRPTHGYEATREAAMTTFAKSWRRE
jgi:hypothetical protein